MDNNGTQLIEKIRSQTNSYNGSNPLLIRNQNDNSTLQNISVINLSETPKLKFDDFSGVSKDTAYKTLSSGEKVPMFKNIIPGTDNNERLAQAQSGAEQAFNGTLKAANNFGTVVLGNTLGFVYGIGAAATTGNFNSVFDNSFMRSVDDWNTKLNYQLPNYYTKDAQNSGFFGQLMENPTNTIFNDVFNGLSFTLGTVVSEAMWATATGGASIAARAGQWGAKAANFGKLGRVIENVVGAERVAKWGKIGLGTETAIDGLKTYKGYLAQPIVNAVKAGKISATEAKVLAKGAEIINTGRFIATSSGNEAGIEAFHFKKEAEENFFRNFNEMNGREPSSEEIKDFRNNVEDAATGVFMGNMAILGVSNLAMLGNMFGIKAPLKGLRQEFNKKAFGVGVEKVGGTWKALEPSKFQKVARFSYVPVNSSLREGFFEEGGQGVVSKTANIWTERKYDPAYLNKAVDMWDIASEAAKEQYGTKQGMKEVWLGAIIGMIGAKFTGEFSEFKQEDKKMKLGVAKHLNSMESMKTTLVEDITARRLTAVAQQLESQDRAEKSLLSGDVVQAKLAHYDGLLAGFSMADKYDSTDNLVNTLSTAIDASQDISQEEKDVFKQSLEDLHKTYKQADSFAKAIIGGQGRVKGTVDGTTEEVREALTYTLVQGHNSNKLMQETLNEMKSYINEDSHSAFELAGKLRGLSEQDNLELEKLRIDYDTTEAELEKAKQKSAELNARPNEIEGDKRSEILQNQKKIIELDVKRKEISANVEKIAKKLEQTEKFKAVLDNKDADNLDFSVNTISVDDLLKLDKRLKDLDSAYNSMQEINPTNASILADLKNQYTNAQKSLWDFNAAANLIAKGDFKLRVANDTIFSKIAGAVKDEDKAKELFKEIISIRNKQYIDRIDKVQKADLKELQRELDELNDKEDLTDEEIARAEEITQQIEVLQPKTEEVKDDKPSKENKNKQKKQDLEDRLKQLEYELSNTEETITTTTQTVSTQPQPEIVLDLKSAEKRIKIENEIKELEREKQKELNNLPLIPLVSDEDLVRYEKEDRDRILLKRQENEKLTNEINNKYDPQIIQKQAELKAVEQQSTSNAGVEEGSVGVGEEVVVAKKHFNNEAISKAKEAENNNEGILVNMSIDDFLSLNPKGDNADKRATVSKLAKEGTKFNEIPYLNFTHDGNGNAEVTGHEGRHRAMELKAQGETTIPVLLRNRYGGQGEVYINKESISNAKNFNEDLNPNAEKFPTKLRGHLEQKNVVIDFPLKEQSLKETTKAETPISTSGEKGKAEQQPTTSNQSETTIEETTTTETNPRYEQLQKEIKSVKDKINGLDDSLKEEQEQEKSPAEKIKERIDNILKNFSAKYIGTQDTEERLKNRPDQKDIDRYRELQDTNQTETKEFEQLQSKMSLWKIYDSISEDYEESLADLFDKWDSLKTEVEEDETITDAVPEYDNEEDLEGVESSSSVVNHKLTINTNYAPSIKGLENGSVELAHLKPTTIIEKSSGKNIKLNGKDRESIPFELELKVGDKIEFKNQADESILMIIGEEGKIIMSKKYFIKIPNIITTATLTNKNYSWSYSPLQEPTDGEYAKVMKSDFSDDTVVGHTNDLKEGDRVEFFVDVNNSHNLLLKGKKDDARLESDLVIYVRKNGVNYQTLKAYRGAVKDETIKRIRKQAFEQFKTGKSGVIGTTIIERVELGVPILSLDNNGSIKTRPITEQGLKNIKTTGYIQNGELVLAKEVSNVRKSYVSKLSRSNKDKKIPVVVIEQGQQMIAFPVTMTKKLNSQEDKLMAILESSDNNKQKVVQINNLLSNNKLAPVLTSLDDTTTMEQIAEKLSKVENFTTADDLTSSNYKKESLIDDATIAIDLTDFKTHLPSQKLLISFKDGELDLTKEGTLKAEAEKSVETTKEVVNSNMTDNISDTTTITMTPTEEVIEQINSDELSKSLFTPSQRKRMKAGKPVILKVSTDDAVIISEAFGAEEVVIKTEKLKKEKEKKVEVVKEAKSKKENGEKLNTEERKTLQVFEALEIPVETKPKVEKKQKDNGKTISTLLPTYSIDMSEYKKGDKVTLYKKEDGEWYFTDSNKREQKDSKNKDFHDWVYSKIGNGSAITNQDSKDFKTEFKTVQEVEYKKSEINKCK